MSRESVVLFIGLIVLVTPFVGVPSQWKPVILSACGFILMVVGFSLRRAAYLRRIDKGNGERGTDSFSESVNVGE